MAALEITNLTVEADGRKLVDNVNLALRPGELVAMIGPNGAGKSTILRSVVGSARRSAGSVILGDKPIEQWAASARARQLSYMPQDRYVGWNLTVEDVVSLGRFPHADQTASADGDADAVARALARVGAEHLVRRRFGVLSGGEKALVLLARTLAVQAPLVMVDEPIAGLDPYHQLQVMEVLKAVSNAHGVLIVLHDLTLASRFADRLVLLDRGRIVAAGSAAEVLDDGLLAATFGISVRRSGEGCEATLVPWGRLRK